MVFWLCRLAVRVGLAGTETRSVFLVAQGRERGAVLGYLDDLVFGGLLGQLADAADKLLVGRVVGFAGVYHPDAQLHELEMGGTGGGGREGLATDREKPPLPLGPYFMLRQWKWQVQQKPK